MCNMSTGRHGKGHNPEQGRAHGPGHRPGHGPHRAQREPKARLTALVVIPPEEVWEPIQAIRRAHDSKFRRWMPHISLLYPFRPRAEFDLLTLDLVHACEHIAPFEVRLADFRAFHHEGEHYTLWLAPEPEDELDRLHYLLWRVAPDCDEVRKYEGGYRPHLSVGQVTGKDALERLLAELRENWQPLSFAVSGVSLIWRDEPPDDVFRVDRTIPLGGEAQHHAPDLLAELRRHGRR